MQKAPNTLKKLLCSALMGGMLLSLGGVASASDIKQQSGSDKRSEVTTKCPKHGHYKAFNPEKMKVKMQKRLSKLVESGDLSQAKADKVAEYYYKTALERKALYQKAKGMNKEERHAYIKKIKKERKSPLVQLVKDGAITQQEADSIAKVMPKRHHKKTH